MVVNVGKVLGNDRDYVEEEIRAINKAVVGKGVILKVIFENDYLNEQEIITLCEICTRLEVALVRTSTGYGFVKDADGSGMYSYKGATMNHLRLMRKQCGDDVRIKAAGGVRTLDDFNQGKGIRSNKGGCNGCGGNARGGEEEGNRERRSRGWSEMGRRSARRSFVVLSNEVYGL